MDVSLSLENGMKEVSGNDGPVKKTKGIRTEEGPDGRLAWLVALAACTINFVMAGLQRMSGILFVAFIATYGVDRKSASMPSSVKTSTGNLLGPVVGILGQKYGVRRVAVVGGSIATISAVLCFFAPDCTWVVVLWGGVGGLGTALTVTLPQVVIGQYFDKHRTTAAGMAFSGGCVGAFLFPKLLNFLLEKYGLQGTFLVLGGVIAHTIPAAMMLSRPPWLKKPERKNVVPKVVVSSAEESCDEGSEVVEAKISPDIEYLRRNGELVAKMLAVKTPVGRCLSVNQNEGSVNHVCVLEEMADLYRSLQVPKEKGNFQKNLTLPKSEKLGGFGKDVAFKDKSFRVNERAPSTPVKLSQNKSVPDLSKLSLDPPRDSLVTKLKGLHCMKSPQIVALFPEENKRKVLKVSRELRKLFLAGIKPKHAFKVVSKECPQKNAPRKEATKDSFLDHMKTAVSLHFKPLFLLICLCRCVHFITFLPVMTTIVDYVKDKGFEAEDGSYAIAALSLGDLIGRLCFGWVTDRGFLKIGKYMLVVMVLQGASTASLPLMGSRIALFGGLAVFGMLQGSLFVRHPVLVSLYMEPHEQSIAMGCVNFFSGLLGFGLPTYIGYFRDTLHSYDYIFYINGCLGALTGLLWATEPYFVRSSRRLQESSTSDKEESV